MLKASSKNQKLPRHVKEASRRKSETRTWTAWNGQMEESRRPHYVYPPEGGCQFHDSTVKKLRVKGCLLCYPAESDAELAALGKVEKSKKVTTSLDSKKMQKLTYPDQGTLCYNCEWNATFSMEERRRTGERYSRCRFTTTEL